MNKRNISMISSRNSRKRILTEKYFRFILICGIVLLIYFGMRDFLLDEIIIPQLNIYISARTVAVISLIFIGSSFAVSSYITDLTKTEDWIHSVVCPLFVLIMVKLLQYRERFALAVIFLICTLMFTVFVMKMIISDIRNRDYRHIEGTYRLMNSSIVCIGLVPAIVLLITRNTYLKTATVDKFTAEQATAVSDEYAEYITRFHPDKWEELSCDEKLDAVSYLVKYESERQDIHCVEAVDLIAYNNAVLAHYDYDDKKIAINETYFLTSDSYSVMNSVLHEFYHSVQHYAVDEYNALDDRGQELADILSDVDEWAAELGGSYVQGDQSTDGYINYYEQYVEASAREYGEERCAEYKEEIEKLVNSDMY